ncbi:MAG: rRNA maturation RNase YbeY [Lentimicrobium sp.]|nr:rRNA maturation RNase YbeY [Lentimicrobium sp.]
MASKIGFYSEDVPFRLSDIRIKRQWLEKVIESEGKIAGEISYIFCSDDYLYKMNVQYLNHDTLTDVITFDYTEANKISGDIFISIPRVEENASEFGKTFADELNRVMVHGILHLCGYKDKTTKDEKIMRLKEDEKLELLKM